MVEEYETPTPDTTGTSLVPVPQKDVAPHHISTSDEGRTLVRYADEDGVITKTYSDGSTVTIYPMNNTSGITTPAGAKPFKYNSNWQARSRPVEPTTMEWNDPSFTELRQMLAYRRQGRTRTEKRFIKEFISPLDCKIDGYGNLYKRIGNAPVMWACHTDSVHSMGGMQNLAYEKAHGILSLATKETTSNCLGADDAAGIFVMTQMIKAGVEGLYVFHRDEESGGGGSRHFAKHHAADYKHVNMCVSLDRYGYNSVITHQWGRCCSDEYGDALADALNGTNDLFQFEKDPGGLFTDSANYTDEIAECTNLSVGYYGHHGSTEEVSVPHLLRLIHGLSNIDVSTLPVKRVPGTGGYGDYYGNRASWSDSYKGTGYFGATKKHPKAAGDDWWKREYEQDQRSTSYSTKMLRTDNDNDDAVPYIIQPTDDEIDDIANKSLRSGNYEAVIALIEDNPYEVWDLLEDYGFDTHMLCVELRKRGVEI